MWEFSGGFSRIAAVVVRKTRARALVDAERAVARNEHVEPQVVPREAGRGGRGVGMGV